VASDEVFAGHGCGVMRTMIYTRSWSNSYCTDLPVFTFIYLDYGSDWVLVVEVGSYSFKLFKGWL